MLLLHGVAGVGLGQIQIQAFKKPKPPKPIEVQFINMQEAPTPPVEIAEAAPEPIAPIKQAAPVQTAPRLKKPPKANSPQNNSPKPATKENTQSQSKPLDKPRLDKPKLDNTKLDNQSKPPTSSQTEIPASALVNRSTSSIINSKSGTNPNHSAPASGSADANKPPAGMGGGAKPAGAGAGGTGGGKKSEGKSGNDGAGGASAGGSGGVIKISNANARWKAKPNISVNEDLLDDSRVKNFNPSFKLSVNEKGDITSVSVVSGTGSSKLDRELTRRVRAGKLHPFSENGVAKRGEGTVNIAIPKPKGASKKDKSQDKPPNKAKDEPKGKSASKQNTGESEKTPSANDAEGTSQGDE